MFRLSMLMVLAACAQRVPTRPAATESTATLHLDRFVPVGPNTARLDWTPAGHGRYAIEVRDGPAGSWRLTSTEGTPESALVRDLQEGHQLRLIAVDDDSRIVAVSPARTFSPATHTP
jgi:hypothetical protein